MTFLPASNMLILIDAISAALLAAFHDPAKSEPQLVANFVWELPKRINNSGIAGLSSGGVFIHAQPFVTCHSFPENTPKSVEIGDLLLIRTLVKNNEVVERRALLLQAKKAGSIPATPDNENQWYLYEKWPAFTYAKNSGKLTGDKRDINEPDMYDAAKYLLIGNSSSVSHWHQWCRAHWPLRWRHHWPEIGIHQTAQPTKPVISRYQCFASELVEFFMGNAGKVFNTPKAGTDGWDQVMHDLIKETARARTVFMSRPAGRLGKTSRGSGSLSFMTQAAHSLHFLIVDGDGAANSDMPPKVPDEWLQEDEGGGGISTIEVIVEQRDN